MFERVTVLASDLEASTRFYATVLAALGGGAGDFAVGAGGPTRRLHVGFWVPSHELVDAFWRAGVDAGYGSDGEPGLRPQYEDHYYGGFLLDPDGNSVEACFRHGGERVQGQVDHLWLRTGDLAAARDRVRPEAEAAGFELVLHDDRVQFRKETCSFSFVPGEPTEHLLVELGGGTVTL